MFPILEIDLMLRNLPNSIAIVGINVTSWAQESFELMSTTQTFSL